MYGILGGLYGALLSIMNLMNAQLSAIYGNWAATVMIHLVGLAVLFFRDPAKRKPGTFLKAPGLC